MKYEDTGIMSSRMDGKNGNELMANFTAEIITEVRYLDGANTQTMLTLRGQMPPKDPLKDVKPVELPEIEITAEQFMAMNWVMPNWGVRCVLMPISGVKDDMRTFIQQRSTPEIRVIYKQTGWVQIGKRAVYLHAGGGIGASGNDNSISVALPPELMRYDLTTDAKPIDSIGASLELLKVAASALTWPLLAATLAPVYGPVDFALHLTGRTGSFKSELMSLFQSHYGAGFDARHLPGTWSSTGNAIEALAYYAANAAFTLDDFVPGGTSWQQRAYQGLADKVIRAQGNQAGRARLTDTSSLQQTMYPRGIILSTGEDTPEGHSVRARMLILEIATGDIDADDLTTAQQMRPAYCGTVAWLAQSLAKTAADLKTRTEAIRSSQRTVGHSRTPAMLGRLIATAEDFLARAMAAGFITSADAKKHATEAYKAIMEAGNQQAAFLEDSDPVDVFAGAIRQVLATGGGYLRSVNGSVPRMAEVMGWSKETSAGSMPSYKARGVQIGWVSWVKDELYVDITAGFPSIKKVAGQELALSKQTLFKRLKDSGALLRTDDARSRNTIRITAEGSPRQVLCLSLTKILDIKEIADEEADPIDPTDNATGDDYDDEEAT